MWNARVDESQLESRFLGEISITSNMQMTPRYGKKRRRTKEPFDDSERAEWKAGLKLNIQKTKIMASSPISSWQIDGETMEIVGDFIFLGPKITAMMTAAMKLWNEKTFDPLRKAMTNPDSIIKKQSHYFANKSPSSQSYGFSSSRVWMWELDHKESWALKNWCFWTVVLEKALESPLDYKEIKPVHPKRNQSWILIGRTDAKDETPILWPPNVRNWLIREDLDAGKDWRQEEKGMTKVEIIRWHHRLDGHEFEQALGVGDGQGILLCCSSWSFKESGRNVWLNWTELKSFQTPDHWGEPA